jgi:hypothetical protein
MIFDRIGADGERAVKNKKLLAILAISLFFAACSFSRTQFSGGAVKALFEINQTGFSTAELISDSEPLGTDSPGNDAASETLSGGTDALPESEQSTSASATTVANVTVSTAVSTAKATTKATTTAAPKTTVPPEAASGSVYIGGKAVSLGDTAASLTSKFGQPNRTDKTRSAYSFYVYNSNPGNLFMAAVYNGRVVGFFTNAQSFSFDGINKSSDANGANAAFGGSNTAFGGVGLNGGFYLDYSFEGCAVRVYFDTCMVVSPAANRFRRMMVNSGKALKYTPSMCGVDAVMASTEECIETACRGD